jgi:hypothetical protein
MYFGDLIQQVNGEDFYTKTDYLFGRECVLIYPKAFPKWNEKNKYFRSSIWDIATFEPISLGWRKFTNWGEQPEFEPLNVKSELEFIRKIDGSCLIVSSLDGNVICRTRGTFDASAAENGYEIALFKTKYSKFFNDPLLKDGKHSILFEWTTPTNQIVLKETDEPELWLCGIVENSDYRYWSQTRLDAAAEYWGFRRPERFQFNTVEEMISAVEKFDTEGVVVYGNNGQVLKKCKSLRYLSLHKMRSAMGLESMVDVFFEFDMPDFQTFRRLMGEKFDWELTTQAVPFMSRICDGYKEVQNIIDGFKTFAKINHALPRKEFAKKLFSSYGGEGNNRANFCFCLYDGKDIDRAGLKKILWQCLKK